KESAVIYEMRHYHLNEGKFDDMIARFTSVNLPLFEKYGITVERTWEHIGNDGFFSFLMSFESEESRQKAWDGYHSDPVFLAGKEAQATIIAHIDWYVLREITL